MKKLILIFALLLFPVTCFPEDDGKYKVTINIVYNEIGATELGKLVADMSQRHKDSCEMSIKVDKVVYGVTNDATMQYDIIETPFEEK